MAELLLVDARSASRYVVNFTMPKATPRNAKPKTYRGYTLKVTTPARTTFPDKTIKQALARFAGMKILISTAAGSARPRVKSLHIPATATFGKVFKDGKEVPGYSEKSLWAEIVRTLSRLKPNT